MCASILLLQMCEIIEGIVSKHQKTHILKTIYFAYFLFVMEEEIIFFFGCGGITHPKNKKICPVLTVNCQNYD